MIRACCRHLATGAVLAAATVLVLNGCDPPSVPPPGGGKSFDALMSEGDKALAAGQAEDALVAFDSAVDKDAASALARHRRGQAYLQLRKFDKAIEDCAAALRLNPKLAEAHFTRGQAYLARGQADKSQGDLNKSLDDFSNALDQTPDRADFLAARGAVYQQLAEAETDHESMHKTLDSAAKDFEKALKFNPRDTASLMRHAEISLDRGDHQAAIDDSERALAIDSDLAAARVARARAWIEKGEIDKAIADCDAAVKTDGKRLDAYAVRAKARVERSSEMRTLADVAECDKAVEDCDKALKLSSQVHGDAVELRRAKKWAAVVHELRGILYDSVPVDKKADVPADKKAFDEYSTAISIDPDLADALVRRALNRLKSEDSAGAMSDCNAAIAIDNSRPEGFYGRGMVNRAQRQYKEAIDDFDEALARKYRKAYNGLAIVYSALAAAEHNKALALSRSRDPRQREEYTRAVATEYQYRQKTIDNATNALPSNRHQPQMYLLRGLAYVNSGRETQGYADFNAAIDDDPLVALAYYYRGIYHNNVRRLDDAIMDFTKAIELQPNAVLAYQRRAECYREAGKPDLQIIDVKRYQELKDKITKQQSKDADEENLGRAKGTEAEIGAPLRPIVNARKELERKLDATAVK